MQSTEPTIPAENLSVYELLYQIEVGIREFTIEVMASRFGPRWWKDRLPGDVLEDFRKGREYEKKVNWYQFVPCHPLYYVDFAALKKIIERNDNWTDIFQATFKRKEVIVPLLSELEPIRNVIAHNRKASTRDLGATQQAFDKLSSMIGEEKFRQLVARCTSAQDIPAIFLSLKGEADVAFKTCMDLAVLPHLETWDSAQNSWWFDNDYIGYDLAVVAVYFKKLDAYRNLPRTRGTGHLIETWVKSEGLEGAYRHATECLSSILEGGR